jgi:beta-glucanase (GH16 family)
MSKPFFTTLNKTTLLSLPAWLLLSSNVFSATLFFDDFNGSSLDETVWRLPTGNGTFYGRTQIKPPEFNGQNLRPEVNAGSVTLQLDTYNASDPNTNSFWGHEIQTRQSFLPGANGVSIETRMRFLGTPAGGLVGGFFTWGFDNNSGIRDEIDVELLTNDLAANRERVLTNVYNNTSINEPGDSAFAGIPGFNMTEWNSYEILWLPDRIQWIINGSLIREQIVTVDNNPSEVRLNIWAPNEGFIAAYNSALQPTDAAGNQQYQLEVDYVKVSSVPLPPAFILFSSALGLLAWAARRRS